MPSFTFKSVLTLLFLGAMLHLVGQEVAQYRAAGRLLTCLVDPGCVQPEPAGFVEQFLGYRINLGRIRIERFVKQALAEQVKSVDEQHGK